jgi:isochorismate hydrolase
MSASEPYIDPRVTALLVIDMQKGFCHPESRMEKSGVGTANQRAIVPDLLRLVELARGYELPVFWSQQIHFPEDVTRRRRRIPSHQAKQRWTPCLRGTWEVEFADEIVPAMRPEDYVIEKHRASVLFETTLDTKLRMLVAGPRWSFHEDTLAKVETYFGAVVSLDELPSLVVPGVLGGDGRPIVDEVREELEELRA